MRNDGGGDEEKRRKEMYISLFSQDGLPNIQRNKLLCLLVDYTMPVIPSNLKAFEVLLELVPILNTFYNPLF